MQSFKPLTQLLISLGLFACASTAHATSLMEAYQAALQNDPVYRAAIAERDAGLQYRNLGRSNLLPTLQYSYTTNKNRADTTNLLFNITNRSDYTGFSSNLNFRQPLFNLEGLARYKQGVAQSNYSEAVFSSKSLDLMMRVLAAYCEAKYAEEQVALMKAQQEALTAVRKMNERFFAKGEGTKTDLLETQAKQDIAESQLIEAEDSLQNARDTLTAMIGRDVVELDGLVPDFKYLRPNPIGISEWIKIAEESNGEIIAARFAVDVADQEIAKNRSGHYPRLELIGGISRNLSDSLTTRGQDSTVKSIGVQLVLPLFSGGYVQAASSQAVANREKARAELDNVRKRVTNEVRKQYNAVISTQNKIAALEKSVKSAHLLVEATHKSIQAGMRINVDLLNAQQQLIGASRDLAQARYTHLIAYARLKATAGTMTQEDLYQIALYFGPNKDS